MSDKNVSNVGSSNSKPILSSVCVGSTGKKHSIDDIIDHMTADLQSYDGQYIVLGSQHNNSQHIWSEYNTANNNVNVNSTSQVNHGNQSPSGVTPVQLSQVVGNHPIFLQQPPPPASYELRDCNVDYQTPQCGSLFYTTPNTARVQDGATSNVNGGEMIGMVDVGGGNFVNVVFNSPHGQLHPQYGNQQPSSAGLANPNVSHQQQQQQSIPNVDTSSSISYMYQQHQQSLNNTNQVRDYGLFNNKDTTASNQSPTQPTNRQLIENLVGNWLPNQSGTYSPFGGSGGRPSCTIDKGIEDNIGVRLGSGGSNGTSSGIPGNNNRKQRAVAEVRPMRPTYSDVLTKSPPPPLNNNNNIGNNNNSSNINNGSAKVTSVTSSNNSTQSGNSTPKLETRKHGSKTNKSGGNKESSGNSKNNSANLKRQHSGGSDDNTNGTRLLPNIHKWMSIEELSPSQSNLEPSCYDHLLLNDSRNSGISFENESNKRGDKKQKKKQTKQKVNEEKVGTLNNDKVGGIGFVNTSISGSINNNNHNNNNNNNNNSNNNNNNSSKRSLQINNNLLRNRSNTEKNLSKSKKGNNKDESKISMGSSSSSKRSQRSGKRRNCQTYIGLLWNKWQHYMVLFATWFFHLLWDVLALSSHLFVHMVAVSFEYTLSMMHCSKNYVFGLFGNKTTKNSYSNSSGNRFKGANYHSGNSNNNNSSSNSTGTGKQSWWKFWSRNKKPVRPEKPNMNNGLTNNMAIPTTGDEAIRRLLSCKGKDPYSILGVTRNCTDDDIKKYYKRQAVLVHPDKNSQPGAEEAFKILVHAFELIGEPEKRSRYDHCVAETHQMEHAWTELNDLLTQLHQKMEYTANTIRCTNCGKRHRRVPVQRPCYAARFCAQCKIHHSAREGDIWAESWIMGFVWHYYACMEGQIYNITEWASCQAENLLHLKANSHAVQYRIVLGKQQQQQHEPQHQQSSQQRQSEPDLEEFLNNLYSQSNSGNTNQGTGENLSRQRRKTKRKK